MKLEKKNLLVSTVMLYILTFSKYILNFITVPYETRVLGPEFFGLLGLAAAVMVYFQLFIDFGFLLSATEEVSNHREDTKKLSQILSSVTLNKLFLAAISFVILFGLCQIIPRWKEHTLLLMLYLASSVVGSLLPDYLYRGMEKMTGITVRSVSIRALFTVLVFVLVKDSSDYLLIPILLLFGNVLALLAAYLHLFLRFHIRFCGCNVGDIFRRMRCSATFFLSRIASTVYTAANTIMLDFMSNGAMTAYYTSADKIVTTAKSGMSPIADSMYPYMVRNKDFRLVKKVLLVLEPLVLLGCAVVFIWAEPLCVWFFGDEYAHTGEVMRALLPIVAFVLPSYLFGFPMLSAMGLSKHANYSVMFGSAMHVINLVVLIAFGWLNMISLAIVTSITEGLILLYRIVVVIRHRDRLAQKGT